MTKLKIISRLWSHITDLRMLIRGQGTKTLEEIESEIDITEYYCRPYADADDIEAYLGGGEDMEDVISRAEHEEFRKNIEAENHRQNRRIELLEENTNQINALTISVEKLAQSIELMVGEQKQQGKRLETLENRDGEMWRKVTGYVVTAIIGIVLGWVATQVGM